MLKVMKNFQNIVVNVDPNTKINLDIRGFKIGELINLEFGMDLFLPQ